jgi:hypothetical protein
MEAALDVSMTESINQKRKTGAIMPETTQMAKMDRHPEVAARIISDFHHDETRIPVTTEQGRRILAGHDIMSELTDAQRRRARKRLCGSQRCTCGFTYTYYRRAQERD